MYPLGSFERLAVSLSNLNKFLKYSFVSFLCGIELTPWKKSSYLEGDEGRFIIFSQILRQLRLSKQETISAVSFFK